MLEQRIVSTDGQEFILQVAALLTAEELAPLTSLTGDEIRILFRRAGYVARSIH